MPVPVQIGTIYWTNTNSLIPNRYVSISQTEGTTLSNKAHGPKNHRKNMIHTIQTL